jgi:arsenite methyltransferase
VTYFDTLLRSQLGKPSGLFGSWIVAPMLNFANTGLVSTTVELLEPKPDDAVLDIGFGGGASLWAMARKLPHGKITGVDYSHDMVDNATRLIQQKRLRSRVSVRWGDVADLPFRAGTFDRIITINSLYYWPDLMAGLREMARVLKRHGRVAVGFHSPQGLRPFTSGWDNFVLYEPQELADLMPDAGFEVLRVELRDRWLLFDTAIVVARRH